MVGLKGEAQADIVKAISQILVVQAVTSGLVAIAIVVGAIFLSMQSGGATAAFELLKNWGGVVIGFYFGTAYTQISSLVSTTGGGTEKPQKDSG